MWLVTGRPTIQDVAERAGVSIATVSRVLNDKRDVSAPTRERVRAAATELGYTADTSARALVSRRTQLVGVVVGDNSGHRDLSLIFFGKVLAAISRRLSQSGYDPLLLHAVDRRSDRSPLDAGFGHRFDAAMVIGVDDDDPLVSDLAAHDLPLVGVDVRCEGAARAAFVGSDHAEGVRLAVSHLHALGHRRIAHVAGAHEHGRRARAALGVPPRGERLGLDLPDEYVRRGDFSSASGYAETCTLLALPSRRRPMVAASDLMALAALQAIREAGCSPGHDVAVVGFDDLEAAALAYPPLTTIRQDRQELGTLAAKRAIELIEDPGRAAGPILPVELVVRASSAA